MFVGCRLLPNIYPTGVGLGVLHVLVEQLVWGPWPESSDTLTRQDWEVLTAAATKEKRSLAQAGRSRWGAIHVGCGGGEAGVDCRVWGLWQITCAEAVGGCYL